MLLQLNFLKLLHILKDKKVYTNRRQDKVKEIVSSAYGSLSVVAQNDIDDSYLILLEVVETRKAQMNNGS